MSIIKNFPASGTYGRNTGVTIMKLEKGVALASPPLPNKTPDGTSYNHPLKGFTPKLYLEVNNYMFQLGFYARAGETVIIRAALDVSADGVIYGIYNSSDTSKNRYVCAEGQYLKWYEGTSVVYSKAIDGNVHNFGYQGYSDNGTLKCKPYYDKIDVEQDGYTGSGSTSSFTTSKAVLNQLTGQTFAIHSNNTWAIRIYEVAACSYPSASDSSLYMFHYYAAINTSSVACLMETRYDVAGHVGQEGTTMQGTTNRKEAGDFPNLGYGVQLFDLKYITGSGYNDLMALVADDGGIDSAAGWSTVGTGEGQADEPSALSKNGDVREFAFCLNGISKPSGWTYSEHYPNESSHGYGYEAGELHTGRQPKWSIWNDCIKFGFHVIKSGDDYKMRFNFLKIIDPNAASELGTINGKIGLDWFDGYSTTPDAIHPPQLVVNDNNVTLYMHNGAFLKCLDSNITLGYHDSGSSTPDQKCIFFLDETVGGNVYYRVGNLAPWNWTASELANKQYRPTGVQLTVRFLQGDYDYLTNFGNHILQSGYLTKDLDSTTKTEYRVTGWTESLQMYGNRWYLWDYINEIYDPTEVPEEPVPAMWVHLNLKAKMTGDTDKFIDCTRFVPDKKILLYSSTDHKIVDAQTTTNYRMVVEPILNGADNKHMGIITGFMPSAGLETHVIKQNGGVGATHSFVYVPFIECTLESQQGGGYWPKPVYKAEGSITEYKALMEIYYSRTNQGTTYYHYSFCFVSAKDNAGFYAVAGETWYPTFWGKAYGINGDTKRLQCGQYSYQVQQDEGGVNVNNADLVRCMRFAVAEGSDFGLDDNGIPIPEESTVITHIYESNVAPVIICSVSDNWDDRHHVVYSTVQQYDLRLATTLPYFTKPSSGPMVYKFKTYDYVGVSQQHQTGYIEYPWSSLGNIFSGTGVNVRVLKNGTLIGMVAITSIGGVKTLTDGSTIVYYEGRPGETNEMFFGLDDTYTDDGFQVLELTPSNPSAGDIYSLEFPN